MKYNNGKKIKKDKEYFFLRVINKFFLNICMHITIHDATLSFVQNYILYEFHEFKIIFPGFILYCIHCTYMYNNKGFCI